jgi:potassium efflux system protein
MQFANRENRRAPGPNIPASRCLAAARRAGWLLIFLPAAPLWAAAPEGVPLAAAAAGLPLAATPAGLALAAAPQTITADEVKSSLAQLDQSADIPADVKAKAAELYKQALEELRIANDWSTKTANFKASRQSAPKELEDLKTQLSRPLADVAPQLPPHAALDELKQLAARAETAHTDVQTELTDLEAAARRRSDRFEEVRVLDGAAKQRLDFIGKQLAELPATLDGMTPLDQATRALLLAKNAKTLAEHACYEEELPAYEATRELMRAKLDWATRRLNQAEELDKKWRAIVTDRSRQDAETKAYDARWTVMNARPEVLPLAEENEKLADLRTSADGPAAKLKRVQEEVSSLNAELVRLQSQAAHIKKVADLTDSIGILLQKQRNDLPDLRLHRKHIAARQTEITNIKLQLFELETRRSELADIDAAVRQVINDMELGPGNAQRAALEPTVRELLETRRDYLDALIADDNNYFNALVLELDKTEQELIRETEAYANYINERIFWIRSSPPLEKDALARAWHAARWLGEPAHWALLGETLWADVHLHAMIDSLGLAAALAMLYFQRRVRRRVHEIGRHVANSYTDSINPTIEASLWTVVLALPWPALAWFIGWRLTAAWEAPEFAKTVAFALHVTAIAGLTTELWRQICRRKGLAEAHFRWPPSSLQPLRRNVRWLLIVGLPITFVVALVEQQENSLREEALGRLVYIVGLVALTVFAKQVVPPIYEVLKRQTDQGRLHWLERTHAFWYTLGMALPLSLAVIASLGYYYTALQLTWRLQATVWLLLGLLVAHSFLLRWVLLARRRLAITHARQVREAHSQHANEAHADLPLAEAPGHLDLSTIDTQNRRLLRTSFLLALLIGGWLVWVDVLPALKVLDEWKLWSYHDAVAQSAGPAEAAPLVAATVDAQPQPKADSRTHWVTVGDLVLAMVIVLMTLAGSQNLPGLLEIAWFQHLPLDAGGRYALTSVSRYLILVVGVVASTRMIGIGWANVQWLAAAITVGLGFGLQEIFANFVSGLIILFERPVRVGDTVTICGVTGTVSRIRSRATTIIDRDRKELIVPNKEFITGQVVNWTLTDSMIRLSINLGVAYGTDLQLATRLLLEAADKEPQVLREPAPMATFVAFGDSSLSLELHVFLPSLDKLATVRHSLNMAIDEIYRKAGIEIPFPQQDVHVRTLPGQVLSLTDTRRSRTVGSPYEEQAKSA